MLTCARGVMSSHVLFLENYIIQPLTFDAMMLDMIVSTSIQLVLFMKCHHSVTREVSFQASGTSKPFWNQTSERSMDSEKCFEWIIVVFCSKSYKRVFIECKGLGEFLFSMEASGLTNNDSS